MKYQPSVNATETSAGRNILSLYRGLMQYVNIVILELGLILWLEHNWFIHSFHLHNSQFIWTQLVEVVAWQAWYAETIGWDLVVYG